jgi:hypothetical protein
MAGLAQRLTQRAQATSPPLVLGHRIACRFGLDSFEQSCFDHRVFFSVRGRPAPGTRTPAGGRSLRSGAHSRRPRWMVVGSRPVIRERCSAPPWPRGGTQARQTSDVAVRPSARSTGSSGEAVPGPDAAGPFDTRDMGRQGSGSVAWRPPSNERGLIHVIGYALLKPR